MSSPAVSASAGLRVFAPQVIVPAAGFLAGLLPIVALGFDNGGYGVQAVAGVGVVLWWLLLVGIVTGALPRPRPTRLGAAALAATSALAIWGAVTLGWSASEERGLTEVVRMTVYGGALLLGMTVVSAGQQRALLGGVLCGLVAIVGAGVLSRLQPDLFAGSSAIADGLGERTRLSWPLNYWNAMGAAAALALPLAIGIAVRARTAVASGLAAAVVPIVALGLVLTLSRGGTIAAALGLVLVVAAVAPRLVVLRTMLAPAIGAAIVIAATLSEDAIRDAVGGAAQSDAGQGRFALIALVTVGVGLVQAGWHVADGARALPRLPRPSRPVGLGLSAAAAVLIVVAAFAIDVPGRAADGWSSFKDPDTSGIRAQQGSVGRLTSANSTGRYEEWSNAIDAIRENPLGGIGLGSWDAWFSPRRDTSPPVRNAHSQPLEIGAETGVPGLAAFGGLLLLPFVAGGRALLRQRGEHPDLAVIAIPSAAAFAIVVSVDWSWQTSAIPVAAALTVAPLLSRDTSVPSPVALAGARDAPQTTARVRSIGMQIGVTLAAVASIGVLAVALIAPDGVDASRMAAANGSLSAAQAEASRAASAAPFSLEAATQRALVAERAGDLPTAAKAARAATQIEPRNWRPWMVLARIEAARKRPKAAIEAYRRAREINPKSRVLNP